MTWMGNGNECDYKLKFSDTSKVKPTIVFKSKNQPCKKFIFMQIAPNLKMSHLFKKK